MRLPPRWPETRAKARIFKAMGHPTRLFIVELLARGPRCVCEIVDRVPGRQATISRHLAVLVGAGILRRHRKGVRMIYDLALPCLLEALPCVVKALRSGRCGTE